MNWLKHLDKTAGLLIVAAALSRLIPHWPNFTPVMAIALFAGATFAAKRSAVIVPIAAMILSDIALGAVLGWEYTLHSSQWAVYACVAGVAILGTSFAGRGIMSTTFLGGSIAAVGFFLVTNFAVWLGSGMYAPTVEGLMACYAAGLAFYRDGGNFFVNGLVSTWVFTAGLMALHALASRKTVQLGSTK